MRAVVLLLLAALPAAAQQARETLYADLSGEWQIQLGDDPHYAGMDFDDSRWKTMRVPWRGEVPLGTFWLRRKIVLPRAPTEPLALALGSQDAAYHVFVNGIEVGAVTGAGDNAPRAFRLDTGHLARSNWITVAIRLVHPSPSPYTPLSRFEDEGPYLITIPEQAATAVLAVKGVEQQRRSPLLVIGLIHLLIGICVLILWRSAKDRMVFFWLGLYLLTSSFNNLRHAFHLSEGAPGFLYSVAPLALAEIAEVILSAFRRNWHAVRIGVWVIALAGQLLPATQEATVIVLAGIGFGMTIACAWRGTRAERWLAIPLLVYTGFYFAGRTGFVPTVLELGSWRWVNTGLISVLASTAIVAALMRQLGAERQEKQRLAGEIAAARMVQQLLFAQEPPVSADYVTDAFYRPAQEVGGDFYYWLKAEDGGFAAVAGDVSGKGLRAAMLVSLLIGALRDTRERSPAGVLGALNAALMGQTGGGFVTCCCARFDPDGRATFANGGHPSPYHNGREVQLEAGLPLGIVQDAVWEETTVTLGAGDQVCFVSDGVVEAANAKGELFGFDRTAEISRRSAKEIVDTALAWGQDDDITVVTVRYG